MSLLLDALKRAEQEKLARQGEASNDAAATAGGGRPKAAPALELQPVAAPAQAGRNEEPAHAAQVLFDAKTLAEEKRPGGMLWATLAAIAVVVASAAGYIWYQVRVLSPATAAPIARRPLPPPQLAAGSPPPLTPLAEASKAPVNTSVMQPERTIASAAPAEVAVVPRIPVTLPAEDPVARALREAPAASAAPPLRLARTLDAPSIPADVTAGYAALRQGDLAESRRRYQAALAADPASVDARLGLATVEARAGNETLARMHYRGVLEMDSRNATALAGIAALADSVVPERIESQLREDAARFPENAQLRFALGSHYAAQRRWGEAQAAFYEAYRLEPANADILYNLAVSLDHMRQTRLAAEFYRRAIEAAQGQPTQFDPTPVRRRLAELTER